MGRRRRGEQAVPNSEGRGTAPGLNRSGDHPPFETTWNEQKCHRIIMTLIISVITCPAQTNLSLPQCLSSWACQALGADTCPLTQAEEPPSSPGLPCLRWRHLVNCIHTPQPPCQVLGLLPPETLQRASLAMGGAGPQLGDDRGRAVGLHWELANSGPLRQHPCLPPCPGC